MRYVLDVQSAKCEVRSNCTGVESCDVYFYVPFLITWIMFWLELSALEYAWLSLAMIISGPSPASSEFTAYFIIGSVLL